MKFPTYKNELQKLSEGFLYVAGCDEVGIGPLAGPVVAAAVILDPKSVEGERTKDKWWFRVRDSKTTSEKERAQLVNFITEHALAYAVSEVNHRMIDEINILNAAHLAMKQAVEQLTVKPDVVLIDGKHKIKNLDIQQQAIVDGDADVLTIAAASIVAKVARDKILDELHEKYPAYGFAKHKGYPTKEHREAIIKHGITPFHRTSFGFVRQAIENRVR
jgi:ribonuclease HII